MLDAETQRQKGEPIRILHVDDDSTFLEISKLLLLEIDNNLLIDHSCRVSEAFDMLARIKYDVVVSDYEMPQKDGLSFLRQLREQSNFIPFILFTGMGREEVAIKALNLGADGYHNKNGSPDIVYGELLHNIKLTVEKNRVKKALREQEERFAKFLAQVPGMIYQFLRRPEGTYCVPYTSNYISFLFGCSPEEAQNDFSLIAKIIVPEDIETVINSIEQSAADLSVWQCEFRVKVLGEIRWIWGHSVPERLDDGSVVWNGFATDITEHKNAEERLKTAYYFLERVGESIDAGLALISTDYRVFWANSRLRHLEVLPSKRCYEIFNNLSEACPNCGAKKVFEQHASLDVHEFQVSNCGRESAWIELRVTPLKDAKGNLIGALELAIPITERKLEQAALLVSEEKFRKTFNNGPNAFYIATLNEGKMVEINKHFEEMFGYTKGEIIGRTSLDLGIWAVSSDREKIVNLLKEKEEVTNLEIMCVKKNGELFPTEFSVSVLSAGNEQLIVGVIRDISIYRKAEDALKRSEQRYKDLADSLPQIVFETDINGILTFANKSALDIMGYSKEEFSKGISIIDLIEASEQQMAIANLKKLLTNECEVGNNEYSLVKKGGTMFPAIILSNSVFVDGKPVGTRGIAVDITERKNAEEELNRSMNQLMIVNEKLGVVGSLTRHDVRNKLSVVNGHAHLLKKKHKENPDIIDGLSKIEQAVKDAVRVFDFARLYEQIGVEELAFINVEKAVNEAIALFSCLDLKVVNECQGLTVLADSLLPQLLYNLMDNTKKHGKKATTIRVYYESTNSGELRLV
jgi:PAS domain S-box-containing protein